MAPDLSSYGKKSMGLGMPFKGLLSHQLGRQTSGPASPKVQGRFQKKQGQTQQVLGPFQPNNKPILQPKKSWADVVDVKAHRSPMRLEFFLPLGTQSEIPLVKLPSDVIDECTEY